MPIEMVNANTLLSDLAPEARQEVQSGFDQLLQSVIETGQKSYPAGATDDDSINSALEPVLGFLSSPLSLGGQAQVDAAESLAGSDSQVLQRLSSPLEIGEEEEGSSDSETEEPEDVLALFEEFRQNGEFDPQRVLDYLGVTNILTWTPNTDMA
jgi:hypothetical protein